MFHHKGQEQTAIHLNESKIIDFVYPPLDVPVSSPEKLEFFDVHFILDVNGPVGVNVVFRNNVAGVIFFVCGFGLFLLFVAAVDVGVLLVRLFISC